ncbi:MAG: hypothetical protein MK102_04150 [Fuerstiella sp.]|nr:hypothetical protein [Fuerstiella sp.]
MDADLILPVISRWAHIGCAIVLIGGSAFIWLVLQPVLRDENAALHDRIRNRWKKFVHPGVLIFLASGIYNFVKAVPDHRGDSLYHMLIGTKMLLALIVFALASILVGNKPGTQKIRDNARKWLGISLLLSTVIVGISGFVKIRPYSTPVSASIAVDTNTK